MTNVKKLAIGNGIKKTLKFANAHYPRDHADGMINPDARLKVAYNEFALTHRVLPSDTDKRAQEALNLVFAHGAQMCKELWDYIIELFFNDPNIGRKLDRAIAIDAACHGDSFVANADDLSFENTWEDAARDIGHVVRDANLKGTTILVGHSMGGTQCLYAGFYEPGLFDSIVVIDPQGFTGDYDSPQSAKNLGGRFLKLMNTKSRDSFKDYDDYYNYMTKIGLSADFHPRIQKDFIDASAIKQPDGSYKMKVPQWEQIAIYMSGQVLYRDSIKVVGSLDCEVLHIFPTEGYYGGAKAFRDALRFPTLVDIPKTGHLVPFEQPHETFDSMKDFIWRRYQRGAEIKRDIYSRKSLTPSQRHEYVQSRFNHQISQLSHGKRLIHSRL